MIFCFFSDFFQEAKGQDQGQQEKTEDFSRPTEEKCPARQEKPGEKQEIGPAAPGHGDDGIKPHKAVARDDGEEKQDQGDPQPEKKVQGRGQQGKGQPGPDQAHPVIQHPRRGPQPRGPAQAPELVGKGDGHVSRTGGRKSPPAPAGRTHR